MHKTRTVTNMNVNSMLLTLQFGWIFEGGTPEYLGQRPPKYMGNVDFNTVIWIICILY